MTQSVIDMLRHIIGLHVYSSSAILLAISLGFLFYILFTTLFTLRIAIIFPIVFIKLFAITTRVLFMNIVPVVSRHDVESSHGTVL